MGNQVKSNTGMFRASKPAGRDGLRLCRAALCRFVFDLFKFYQKMTDKSIQPQVGILQNEVLTVQEVAAYLRVSRVTVWRWCRDGTIPAVRLGRNWRIRQIDLLSLVDHHRAE